MQHDPSEHDPHVTVNELGAGGTGCRIVMNTGALHLRAVALRRRVVDGEQQTLTRSDDGHRHLQQRAGDRLDVSAQTAKK